MITREHGLLVKCQAELLDLACSNVYYILATASANDLALMRVIDELQLAQSPGICCCACVNGL